MPIASTPEQFANAVTAKQSNTTLALDYVYEHRSDLFTSAQIDQLRVAGTLDTLPDWLEDALRNRVEPSNVRLSTKEINHINRWPALQKETKVRQNLVDAMDSGSPMKFHWNLHHEPAEDTKIEPDPYPGTGLLKVTFLSPWANVKVRKFGPVQSMTVDVS